MCGDPIKQIEDEIIEPALRGVGDNLQDLGGQVEEALEITTPGEYEERTRSREMAARDAEDARVSAEQAELREMGIIEQEQERKRRAARSGQASTMLTGSSGLLDTPATARGMLLGA